MQQQLDKLSATQAAASQHSQMRQHWQSMQDYMRHMQGMPWMQMGPPTSGPPPMGPGMMGPGMMGRGMMGPRAQGDWMMGCPMTGMPGAAWQLPPGMTAEQYRSQMFQNMQRMHDQMAKIQSTTDPAERQRRLGRRDALARDVYLAGHHTTFQHAHVQFTLENVSRQLVWSFLHAHPHYNSEQTSQRYVEVKPGAFAVPPLAGEALAVYREACERQTDAYRRLGELLVPVAARAFYATFRGRETQPARWEKAIRKRALEVARYVLPVATFTTLYHTVPAVTLFRYRRLAATFDAPTEQRIVVEAMTDELLRHDPSYAAVLEAPIPLEETPEFALAQALFASPRTDRPGDASFRARFDAGLEGRVSRLVDRKERNEEVLAEAVREVVGASPEALSDDEAIALAIDPARNTLLGEALNLTEHGKLARTLHHPAYTFRKRLSHT
ncbi:MAG: FAD-dependent thymidylate synthase, partial [Gemmatimonadales bacterium]|nr:FAD-dependent thymidylate synthase [Gemmatimonadales bacterium]